MTPAAVAAALREQRGRLLAMHPASATERTRRDNFIRKIDSRIRLCDEDQSIRSQYYKNKRAIAGLDSDLAREREAVELHEQIKQRLYQKYSQRPLKTESLDPVDRQEYVKSRSARNSSLERVKEIDKRKKYLLEDQNSLRRRFLELRQLSSISGKLPDTQIIYAYHA
jgi:hypothetical protein